MIRQQNWTGFAYVNTKYSSQCVETSFVQQKNIVENLTKKLDAKNAQIT